MHAYAFMMKLLKVIINDVVYTEIFLMHQIDYMLKHMNQSWLHVVVGLLISGRLALNMHAYEIDITKWENCEHGRNLFDD